MMTNDEGYITLCFSSSICFNAAAKSRGAVGLRAIPATLGQKQYAEAVAMVSVLLSTAALVCHLDRVTALEKLWIRFFRPRSKFELVLVLFLVLWWSIFVGIGTEINGIAGDGKGQYSLYYSAWASCLCSYWILEKWWVGAFISATCVCPRRELVALFVFLLTWPTSTLFLSSATIIYLILLTLLPFTRSIKCHYLSRISRLRLGELQVLHLQLALQGPRLDLHHVPEPLHDDLVRRPVQEPRQAG